MANIVHITVVLRTYNHLCVLLSLFLQLMGYTELYLSLYLGPKTLSGCLQSVQVDKLMEGKGIEKGKSFKSDQIYKYFR